MRARLPRLLVLCLVAWATPCAAEQLGAVEYRHPATAGELTRPETRAITPLLDASCLVTSLTDAQRASFDAALAHISGALNDPAVRELLRGKSDWLVESDGKWVQSSDAGRRVLRSLTAGPPLRVSVFAYDRDAAHRCDTKLADGDTRAFTSMAESAVLLYRPYLVAARSDADGVAELARTILHETMHVLGYTHPGGPLFIGRSRYNNTVPAYMGCVVGLYPDLQAAQRDCRLPDDERGAIAARTR